MQEGIQQCNYMLAQPPFDAYYLLHLTYALRYKSSGIVRCTCDVAEELVVWKFDKKVYMDRPPPRAIADPPVFVNDQLVRLAVRMVNEATEGIPCWDDYVQHKRVTTQCTASTSRV